ncbi:hypothetical protein FEF34_33985 [Streptomyces marianii]|uniref:Uncharacterized protein n=1 Tax=Streptomyces marianii TaxID=1817406 RepID=A0A5R9EAW7_9ACTN|nr:hypothetical protein FEF34_33985 [Streptomyces marianii]
MTNSPTRCGWPAGGNRQAESRSSAPGRPYSSGVRPLNGRPPRKPRPPQRPGGSRARAVHCPTPLRFQQSPAPTLPPAPGSTPVPEGEA